jgi:MYXO-CTERM domain-containing protein
VRSRVADLTTGNCASVAFDGKSFVLAWRAPSVAGDASSLDLYVAELSPEGEVLRQFAISEEPGREGAPFLAAGGEGQVLAAYTRFVPGAPYDTRRAQARRLTPEDPGPIPDDAGPGAPDAGPPGPMPDAGGSPVDPPPGGGDGGCGCHIGAEQRAPVAPLVLIGGVAALWLVRRRRAR